MNRRFKNKTKQQVAVIGLGRFGTEMTRYLYSNGCDVMAVDIAEERTLAVADYAVHTLVADASDESTLKRMGIESFDTVVIAIGQSPNPLIKSTTKGLETKPWGGIEADEETGATSIKGVFAGGDAVTGAATVILAMGAGKTAAAAIDKYIKGE